jgi:hypothetical protein
MDPLPVNRLYNYIKRPSKSKIAKISKDNHAVKLHKKLRKCGLRSCNPPKKPSGISKSKSNASASASASDSDSDTLKSINILSKSHNKTNVIVAKGTPDSVATDGTFYIEPDTADIYIYVDALGWIQLNGWAPDVGETIPEAGSPANPITGNQYINILTGDLYYYVEGFDWILLNGLVGPAGPAGPQGEQGTQGAHGFSDVFYAVTPNVQQILNRKAQLIKWDISAAYTIQDPIYHLDMTSDIIHIENSGSEPMRFQIRGKISLALMSGDKVESEIYLLLNKNVVPGSLTYCHNDNLESRKSNIFGALIKVEANSKAELAVEARTRSGDGKITVLSDGSCSLEIIKL